MTYEELKKVLATDLHGVFRIEIEFSIKEDPLYRHCSLGKIPYCDGELYWCRVNNEEISAFNFRDFHSLSTFPIANLQTLEELWDRIEIHSIDGFPPQQRLPAYLNELGSL